MQETLEQIWIELEEQPAAAGILKRLLSADWPGHLSAGLVKPGNKRALLLEVSDGVAVDLESLAASEHVDLATSGDERGVRAIQITLRDSKYRDTFSILAGDLAQRVLATKTERDGALALVRSLSRWLRFLKRRRLDLLSREHQLGLYGELTVLSDLIAPVIGYEATVRSWEGPAGAYQDFQLGTMAIEVKALSATRPQQLKISSERQLDDRCYDALVVAHLAVDERQDGGTTLPEVIERIREGLDDTGIEVELFEDRLLEVGYLDAHAHLYAQSGYVHRSVRYYRVGPGFPRLTEDDLHPGVGAVRYRVDASACERFEITDGQLRGWLSDAPPPIDALAEDESLHLEHKATAWKSTNPEVPDRVINEAVVKSVAGFLNSEGGTLVIGVADRTKEILGIAVDLNHLGADVDGYQNRLATLLSTSMGGAAAARVRIDFEERGDRTVCLIRVPASARPVFADSPARKDRRGVFWVRTANSTRDLPPAEAANYIRDHWR